MGEGYILAERLFHGSWSLGPFHCHPFRLSGRGAYTVLHAHAHDHLISANKRIGVYRTDPEELHRVQHGDRRLVKAGVCHLIVSMEEGDTECECLFSRYDEHGDYLADPKESPRGPYRESCNLGTLPDMVQRMLADA